MNGLAARTILGQLCLDTFRQAFASGICWMMLTVTALCVLLCLSVRVSGDAPLRGGDEPILFLPAVAHGQTGHAIVPLEKTGIVPVIDRDKARREGLETMSGRMSIGLGSVNFPVSRERADAVKFLELLLAGGVAGTVGLLLVLIGTAGFVPTFLDPRAAAVLLSKPVERWQLLVGKYLGVLAFVGLQIALFVFLTWLALGVSTQVWSMRYWWCVPLLCLQLAIYLGFSVLLGVITRSTVACALGSVLFLAVSWGINYGSVMAHDLREPRYLPASTLAIADLAYWISPKPLDAGAMLFTALEAQDHFEKPSAFALAETHPSFSPVKSIVSSLVLAAVLLGLAVHEFQWLDY